MAKKTRRRGPADTSRWPFRWALLAALFAHLPLFPTTLFGWLDQLLGERDLPPEEPPGELYLPIDLDLEPTSLGAAAAPAAPLPDEDVVPEPLSPPPVPPRPKVPKAPEIVDAGAPDADALDASMDADAPDGATDAGGLDASTDAGRLDASTPEHDAASPWPPRVDGGPLGAPPLPDGGLPPDAGPDAGGVSDPQRVAGDVAKVPSPSNNVSLTIAADVIREHELGAKFATLLTGIPQWGAFFDGTGIDPIRDVDHAYITGPQFRDTSNVVAVLGFNVAPGKIRAALGKLMARSDPPGEWLKDAPLPTAKALVQGKERLFVLIADKKLLVVMPPKLEKQIAGLKDLKFAKSTGVGISASTITPAKALREVPIRIPASLTKLVVNVRPTKDGGADVEIDATDASADAALKSAADLNPQIEALRVISVAGLFRKEFFAPLVLRAEGGSVRGTTHVPRSTIAYVLGTFEQTAKDRQAADDKKRLDGGAPVP